MRQKADGLGITRLDICARSWLTNYWYQQKEIEYEPTADFDTLRILEGCESPLIPPASKCRDSMSKRQGLLFSSFSFLGAAERCRCRLGAGGLSSALLDYGGFLIMQICCKGTKKKSKDGSGQARQPRLSSSSSSPKLNIFSKKGSDSKSFHMTALDEKQGEGDTAETKTPSRGEDGESRLRLTSLRAGDENGVNGNGNGSGSGGSRLKDDADEDASSLSRARCIALVATVTGAAFLNTLAIQSVVIILPTIGRHLSVPESRQQWIVSSYSLTFGCFLLFWGRVADLYGKRLIFILGSVWVTAVTAANPFVPNEIAFNLFRGLHGLGAAANVPTAIGILGVTFPPGKAKNYAFSTYGAGAPLGSVFGNILSGFIAQYSDWRWVFGALAIMGGIISICGVLFIPLPPPPPSSAGVSGKGPQSIDWIGAALITLGLLALMFALTEGNVVGWKTPWIAVLIVLSILIIAAFIAWQWYLERRLTAAETREARMEAGADITGASGNAASASSGALRAVRPLPPASSPTPPLIKVSIFRNFQFSAVMIIMGLFFAAFNNYLIYATYYFQEFQGLSPLQTMLRFIPTGVGGAAVAVIVSQLLGRVPTVFILISGNLAISIACLLYAVPIAPTTSYFAWGLPAMVMSVIGADTTWPCLTLFTSRSLPREDQAIGGALINAVGQFGRSIGLAISTAVQTAVMAEARGVPVKDVGSVKAWEPQSLRGLRAASWMNFALGIASLAIVPMAFRTLEIVGKAEPAVSKKPSEGVVHNNDEAGSEKREERVAFSERDGA
ncbi:major facilitator superfamily domain-containing protein [Trichoderma ceciliae]